MAECLLRRSGAFHDVRSPPISAPIPMRKQLTGEPVAGELHTGFGGSGRRQPFPTPILLADSCRMGFQLAAIRAAPSVSCPPPYPGPMGNRHGCPDLTGYQKPRPGTRRHPIFGGTFAFSRNRFFGSYLALRATSRSKLAP